MKLKDPIDGRPKMDFEIKVSLNKDKTIKAIKVGKSFLKKIFDLFFPK